MRIGVGTGPHNFEVKSVDLAAEMCTSKARVYLKHLLYENDEQVVAAGSKTYKMNQRDEAPRPFVLVLDNSDCEVRALFECVPTRSKET